MLSAWESQCSPDGAPPAETFDLIPLTGILNQVLVLELLQNRKVRYHFTGPSVADVFEVDPTGQMMEDHIPQATADMMGVLLHYGTQHPAGVHLLYRSSYISGKISENEILMLPLISRNGGLDRMLACQSFGETVYRDEPRVSTRIDHYLHQGTWLDIGAGAPSLPIQLTS